MLCMPCMCAESEIIRVPLEYGPQIKPTNLFFRRPQFFDLYFLYNHVFSNLVYGFKYCLEVRRDIIGSKVFAFHEAGPRFDPHPPSTIKEWFSIARNTLMGIAQIFPSPAPSPQYCLDDNDVHICILPHF